MSPGVAVATPLLTRPLTVRGMTLRNRVVFSAHVTGFARDGIGDRLVAYHEARARGGTGLTVLEAAAVTSDVSATLYADRPDAGEGWGRLADACGRHHTPVLQQLYHPGALRTMRDGSPSWSPSGVVAPDGRTPTSMTAAMIDHVVGAFATAAARCADAGLAGVEVQLGHGFLLGQFLSPLTNLRTDDYGGDADRRARMATDVLAAVRAAVPSWFVVAVRLSVSESVTGGATPADAAHVTRRLAERGVVDLVNLSLGSYYAPEKISAPMDEPIGYQLPLALPVAHGVGVPVVVGGRIPTLARAEAVLASGSCDLVSMVRAQIADPQLVTLTLAGRSHEVRPCIACNQACIGGRFNDGLVGCTVNPAAGAEGSHSRALPGRARHGRRVTVIGGGVAGMEAARAAALRGHDVTLLEGSDRLGGQAGVAALAPGRSEIAALVEHLRDELARTGVDVALSSPVGHRDLAVLDTDAVVLATGSSAGVLTQRGRPGFVVPGAESPHVVTGEWILATPAGRPERVVVFDDVGDMSAVGVVEHLLAGGSTVLWLSSFDDPAPRIAGTLQREALWRRMRSSPALTFAGGRTINQVLPDIVEYGDLATAALHGEYRTSHRALADRVVAVCVRAPRRLLHEALTARSLPGVLVGDAADSRDLDGALRSGRAAGLRIR
nr:MULTISPECIES: FAD-dependent oxidoreductase [unclassified Pseudonocardia]